MIILHKKLGMIPCGRHSVVKMSPSQLKYFIYLPMSLKQLWEELNKKGIRVEVYIRIPEDALEKAQEGQEGG